MSLPGDSPTKGSTQRGGTAPGDAVPLPSQKPPAGPASSPPPSSERPAYHGSDLDSTGRFTSILFLASLDSFPATDPSVLRDLNLDQLFVALAKGKEEYDLIPFFSYPLTDLATIAYRQEVFRDLDGDRCRAAVEAFARSMRSTRASLGRAGKLHNGYQRARWHLDAAREYCQSVLRLAQDLGEARLLSQGFRGLAGYLRGYLASPAFGELNSEVERLATALSRISYCVLIHGDRVTVSRYSGERDYGSEIEETFRRFPAGATPGRTYKFRDGEEMNHVEEAIQERVALLFPDEFRALREFPDRRSEFRDGILLRLDREVQFYLAYLAVEERLRGSGLAFCFPELSESSWAVDARDTYDLVLAEKLRGQRSQVVLNDIHLEGRERIAVVSGPNNGGKTTFARLFGQLHYLARLGCPVPGTSSHVLLSDRIFTHFERVEALGEMRGKLMDELVRIRDIVRSATDRSVIILNETFASATAQDALLLGKNVLGRIRELGALCIYVTFLDELSTIGEETVSVVSTVSEEDPEVRTFKLVRKVADGRAHAMAIARKYGLTYEGLRRRPGA